MSEVEAYGSAMMFEWGPHNLNPLFSDPGLMRNGSSVMLLGHDKGYALRGAAYSVGSKGDHSGHAITFGRTRGGKGVSAIIPALLTYMGSMVVIDPKGENAWITAQRRRDMGHRVIILDPWGEVNRRYGAKAGVTETITKFNPLSSLDPDSLDFADDIAAIAEAFILQTGNDPHWPDSARELTGGLIAAEVQHNPGRASMRGVRKLLRSPIDILSSAVDFIIEQYPDSLAASKLGAVVERDEEGKSVASKEMSSIRSTARTQTAFLDSARLIEAMETDENPFDLSELATGKVTLYLVLPVDRLKSHGRWLRMILTLAIRAISRVVPDAPKAPVVFLLDELGTISPGSGLSMIEQSYGLMAGLGIRIWAFLQDLPQLKRDYPNSWETFIANSSVIQLLNVADNTTAEYFSKYLGNNTMNAKTGSWTWKQVPWKPGEYQAYRNSVRQGTAEHFEGFQYIFESGDMTGQRIDAQTSNVLKELGKTPQYDTRWEPDSQLMSRPVMFPWEIVTVSPNDCVIIMPGARNYMQERFVYYTDPVLSKWARQDPNKPPATVIPHTQPAKPAAPAPEQRRPPGMPPPPPPAPPQSASLTDVAADLGSKFGGFLKKKYDEL